MNDSENPPRGDADSVPPEASEKGRRRRLEGVIPEIVRRAVELGVEKATEAPDDLKELVKNMKLPKEVAHYLLTQIDDTKNGLFRVVAKEIRDFLEQTNFAGEMQKLLTTVQFEVNTTIRFTPNDGRDRKKSKGKDEPKERERERERERARETEEAPLLPDEDEDAALSEPEEDDLEAGPVDRLPKPEVKTAVHVRREGRDDRPLRRRGPRAP